MPRVVAFCSIALAGALLAGRAQAASGAFAVDDSEIGKPGECKVESWTAFAGNGDRSLVAAPACVVDLFRPVELGGALFRVRANGLWSTGLALKAKTTLQSAERHPFGIGVVVGTGFDLTAGEHTSIFGYVPVTFAINDTLRINLNGGWLWDRVERRHFATWGAGFEWIVVKTPATVTLIAEVFGQNANRPAAQAGIRITPHEKFDLDLIYGRNLTGENANWVTVGVNLRF